MAIDPNSYYGTVADADTYFANRLHETDWAIATPENKEKALLAATGDIERLSFVGVKSTVFDLLEENPTPTDAELKAAYDAQLLEWPRDDGDTVPLNVEYACYEIAHERLKGRDPMVEIENLGLTSDGVGSTRVSRDVQGPTYLANGIVSFLAWRFLLPLLDDNNRFDFQRV